MTEKEKLNKGPEIREKEGDEEERCVLGFQPELVSISVQILPPTVTLM